MNRSSQAVCAVAATGAATFAYASLIERNAFVLRRHTVPVLPRGHRPIRIVHVTDIHLVPRQRRKIEWVQRLAALDPDFVVNTGDNLAAQDAVPAALEALGPLMAYPGVFAFGSNDYFEPSVKNPLKYFTPNHRRGVGTTPRLPTEKLRRGFTDAGWLDLNNAAGSLTIEGGRLDFVGVDDPHLDYDQLDLVRRPADPSALLTVGVAHAPYQRVLNAFAEDGCELIIAGHTHGGQVCVPFLGALVTNCDLDTSRAKGVSRWWPGAGSSPSSAAPADAAWLEVSAGLGTAPTAPIRFACRPEASLLTLVPRES